MWMKNGGCFEGVPRCPAACETPGDEFGHDCRHRHVTRVRSVLPSCLIGRGNEGNEWLLLARFAARLIRTSSRMGKA